jgi:hypothetical protein
LKVVGVPTFTSASEAGRFPAAKHGLS